LLTLASSEAAMRIQMLSLRLAKSTVGHTLFESPGPVWPRLLIVIPMPSHSSLERSLALRRVCHTAALAVLILAVAGCEGASFLTEAVMGRTVKAVYQIEDRPTLVLVDDPRMLLGDRALAMQVASNIGFALEQEEVVTTIVPLEDLLKLQARLGDDFPNTPVSRIGRELGAAQVIHVHIEKIDFGSDPGVLKPVATTQVKLIEAEGGRRLFPVVVEGEAAPVIALGAPGYPVKTELWYRQQEDERSIPAIRRKLAEHIARDVARLFHEYKPRMTSQPYDD
jgi:hypothetical protein